MKKQHTHVGRKRRSIVVTVRRRSGRPMGAPTGGEVIASVKRNRRRVEVAAPYGEERRTS